MKKRLEGAKKGWDEELPSILWSYRATLRSSMGETHFTLIFGTEAVILVEIGMPSLRIQYRDLNNNVDKLRVNLNLLERLKEEASIRAATQ